MHNRLLALAASSALIVFGSACGASGDDDANNQVGSGGAGGTTMMPVGPAAGSGGTPNMVPVAGMGGAGMGSGGAPAMTGSGGVTAGSGGMTGSGGAPGMMVMGEDPRGKCGIDTGWADDNACLLPPDPSEGFQVHVGPSDYNDMAEVNKFVYPAGKEGSECFSFHTPNTEEIYYQTFVISGRAGTHHIINTMYTPETAVADGTFEACLDPGTGTAGNIVDNLPGASKAYMPRGTVAPENEGLGRKIPGNAPSQADMHYFNFGETDILREFWMNVYYMPKENLKEVGTQIRGMGGLAWTALPIAPGTDMVYEYTCPIDKDGRIVQLLGHYHAHGKRFTAYVTRAGGQRDKVFEMYDYKDPRTFQYDSTTMNPMFSDAAAGAWTGQLDVKAGDSLDWECHIINDSDVSLTYTNEVKTGEMCNLWGESVGPTLNCVLF